jgi:hypothetical protein
MNEAPDTKRIYLGTIDMGPTVIVVPKRALDRANETFNAAQKQREKEAALAKLQIAQGARSRLKLTKAMRAVFGHRRRGR